MKIKNKLPPIFIINLDIDKKKKNQILSFCKKLNLNCKIINAINGYSLDENEIKEKYSEEKAIADFGKPLTLGELGCSLSHLSIYKKMIDEEIEVAIILEDDIDLTKDFKKVISSIDNLPQNWELVLLGYHSHLGTEKESLFSYRYRKKLIENYESVRLVDNFFGAYGYLINIKGAKKLFNQEITKPIDHFVDREKYINIYAIRPRIVRVNYSMLLESRIELDRKTRNKLFKKKEHFYKLKKNSIYKTFFIKIGFFYLYSKISIFYLRIKKLKTYT